MNEPLILYAYEATNTERLYDVEQSFRFAVDCEKLLCAQCNCRVVRVRSDIVANHFRHASNQITCTLSENFHKTDAYDNKISSGSNHGLSQWHKKFTRDIVRPKFLEITLSNRLNNTVSRADVYVNNTRFEVQHSYIEQRVFEERNSFCRGKECFFYPRDELGAACGYVMRTTPSRAVWLFDATEKKHYKLFRRAEKLFIEIHWCNSYVTMRSADIFIDIGYDCLLKITTITDGTDKIFSAEKVKILDFLETYIGKEALLPNFEEKFAGRTSIDFVETEDEENEKKKATQTAEICKVLDDKFEMQTEDNEQTSNTKARITNVQNFAITDTEIQKREEPNESKSSSLQRNSNMSPEEYNQYHKRLDLEREEKEERLRNAKKAKLEYLKQQEKIELQRKLCKEGQTTLETYFKKK